VKSFAERFKDKIIGLSIGNEKEYSPIATIGNEGLMFFNVAIIDGPTGALASFLEIVASKIKSLGLALEMRKNIIIRIWNMLIILELDLCHHLALHEYRLHLFSQLNQRRHLQ
jgi:hypothetical protein